MSQRMSRTVVTVLAGSALVAALGGCGTSESTDPAAERAHDAVLSDGEFPAGYTVRAVGKSDRSIMSDQLTDGLKDAAVTPAACKSTDRAPDAARTGSVVAVDGASTISTSVAETRLEQAALHAAVTGECANVHVEVNAGPAKGTAVDVENLDVATPQIAGREALVVRQVSTTGGDRPQRRELLIGRAVVDGYLVTVQAVESDGSAPDRADFDAALAAAVAKAVETTAKG